MPPDPEGALEVWLSDEIGEDRLGPALLRGGQIGGAAAFVGIFAAVALASVRLDLPLLVGGGLILGFSLYLAFAMREPRFRRPARERLPNWRARIAGSLRELATTTRAGAGVVRRRPLALTILAVAAIFGGFSEGFDRRWQAHFLSVIGLPDLGALG